MRSGLTALILATALAAPAAADEAPKRGGTLTYMIPADAPPTLDGHRETTYATVHAAAPFYSVLIRINPMNPSSPDDFVCDLCTDMPKPTDDGKTWTFKIRDGVKWHDGSPLTAADVAASWQEIIHPREGVSSARESYFVMVDKVEAPDASTVVFHLKYPTAAFLPALADPFAWIYKKEILDRDPHWYEKNIMGSGPFKFVEYQIGQSIKGARNPDYYHQGLPYLDGFTAIFADKQAVRVDAIRADRAAMEFRGLPPSARDQLVKELGDKITVQTGDWNCVNMITPNHKRKPFDDVRVRRALTLAIDQWHGADALAKIANVHTVGGIVFPGSPLAANKEELQKIAGYWPDIEKSRAEARRLLKEAGAEHLSFELMNRNVDQPYKYIATWVIDEWSKIGVQDYAEGAADRPVLRRAAQQRVRRDSGFQLPGPGESADGRGQVPAALGVHRELRQLRGPEGHRPLSGAAARNRPDEAALPDARVRDVCARHPGAHVHDALVEPDRALPVLREGLEDQPEPLRQSGSRDHMAGRIALKGGADVSVHQPSACYW